MKLYRFFQKNIINIFLLLFILIAFGTILNLSDFNLVIPNTNQYIIVAFIIFLCIQLFLLISAIFNYIDGINKQEKKQYFFTVVVFLIMLSIFLILFFNIHPRPTTDSFDCLDEAMYLLKYGAVTDDNFHIRLMSIYGNNYLLVIIFKCFYQLFSFFGITDFLTPLYIINILSILFSIFIIWIIVKECLGIAQANKTLVLCALNPVYYGIMFWIYSLVWSLPIMMGIVYVGIKLYRSKSIYFEILNSILLGLLVVLGYEIRPTAIFPFIAMVMIGIIFIIKYKLYRKFFLSLVSLILMFGLVGLGINNEKEKYFGEISSSNYPIFFWTSMGSHGNGDLSTQKEDRQIADSYYSYNEKSKVLRERTIENYKELGVFGTINLWSNKIVKTWSDGYSSIHGRMNYGSSESIIYELIAGNHKLMFQIYCQSYRLLTSCGIIIFCIYSLKKSKINNFNFMVLLTIFGGLIFYMIWEAKNIYSAPFLLFMFILAQEGFSSFIPLKQNIYQLFDNKHLICFNYILMMILVVITCLHVFNNTSTFNYYRINTLVNYKSNTPIDKVNYIMQDFYVKKPFNNIKLMAKTDVNQTESRTSSYTISILDSSYNIIRDKTIYDKDIRNNAIIINFDTVDSDTHYYIKIVKNNSELKDILFYTKNTYYLDSYKGNLRTNNSRKFVNDLNMDVMYKTHKKYFSSKSKNIFVVLYILFSIACIYFNGMFRNKLKQYNKVEDQY